MLNLAFNPRAEHARCVAELRAEYANWAVIKAVTPDGDGGPVVVGQGFLLKESDTVHLRRRFREKNFVPYALKRAFSDTSRNIPEWLHFNRGFNKQARRRLWEQTNDITQKHGRKVRFVGHSLNAFAMREFQREHPDLVECGVYMGGPYASLKTGGGTAIKFLRGLHTVLNPDTWFETERNPNLFERIMTPVGGGETAVFSKTDIVASWLSALIPVTAQSENVEVNSSHRGLLNNLESEIVMFDRFGQKSGEWKPFERSKYADLLSPDTLKPEDLPRNRNWKPGPGDRPLFER